MDRSRFRGGPVRPDCPHPDEQGRDCGKCKVCKDRAQDKRDRKLRARCRSEAKSAISGYAVTVTVADAEVEYSALAKSIRVGFINIRRGVVHPTPHRVVKSSGLPYFTRDTLKTKGGAYYFADSDIVTVEKTPTGRIKSSEKLPPIPSDVFSYVWVAEYGSTHGRLHVHMMVFDRCGYLKPGHLHAAFHHAGLVRVEPVDLTDVNGRVTYLLKYMQKEQVAGRCRRNVSHGLGEVTGITRRVRGEVEDISEEIPW